jgi:hypothetical protein
MCDRCGVRVRSCDGQWIIDVIRLSLTGTGRDGEWLRISRSGIHVADVRTVDELAGYVDLAELRAP